MKVVLERYHGLGNDYVVFDPNKNEFELALKEIEKIIKPAVSLAVSPVTKKAAEAELGKLELTKTQETINKAEHTWVDATKKAPKTCSVCGETSGEKLKGCKKSSVLTILSSVSLLASTLLLFRKKR